MGGDTTTKITSGGTATAPSILPELQPFVSRVGQLASGALNLPQLDVSRFANDFTQQIPGLSPLQQGASSQIQNWLQNGMGTPYPAQLAVQGLEGLSNRVGTPVSQSPFFSQGLGSAQQGADVGNRFNQTQLAGLAGLGQFAGIDPSQFYSGPLQGTAQSQPIGVPPLLPSQPQSSSGGNFGQTSFNGMSREAVERELRANSPSGGLDGYTTNDPRLGGDVREAVNQYFGLPASTTPSSSAPTLPPPQPSSDSPTTPTAPDLGSQQSWIGNTPAVQSAIQGLESTIIPRVQNEATRMGLGQSGFLANEVGRQYAQQLVPLYQQGMQQQQQAATSMLGAGTQLQSTQMQALQSLRDTQLALGQNEQALQTDAMLRQMNAAIGSAAPLSQFSQQATNQQLLPVMQAQQMGGAERGVQEQQSQADLQSYLRQRELGLSLLNPFGSYPASGGVPSTNQTQRTSGTSFGK